jgi:arabinofuranosyltransferase
MTRGAVATRLWLLGGAAGFVALCFLVGRFVTDDAWISARYAENLAHGAGWVWNPGGPRVEGFSNPLLVTLEAFGVLIGIGPIAVARALGVAAGLALLALIHVSARPVVGRRAARVALPLIALYPALAVWAIGGLETLPAALAITAGVLPLAREAPTRRDALRAGVAFAVLPWLRPEGIAVALAVALAAETRGIADRDGRIRLALAAGLPLASQALLEALRLAVYGHLLPNSFIYKQGTGGTLDVLSQFVTQSWPLLLVAVAGLIVAHGRQRLLAVPAIVYALGSIGTLDSVNFYSRFFLPLWPQLALLAGIGVAAVPLRAVRIALAGVLVAAGLFAGPAALGTVRRHSGRYARCRQAARIKEAAWLRARTAPGAVFAMSDAGLVPEQAHRFAIDQLLLNEPVIQRTGSLGVVGRADYVFGRHPDVIVLISHSGRRFHGAGPTDSAIDRDPRLRGYHLAHVTGACTYWLFDFVR